MQNSTRYFLVNIRYVDWGPLALSGHVQRWASGEKPSIMAYGILWNAVGSPGLAHLMAMLSLSFCHSESGISQWPPNDSACPPWYRENIIIWSHRHHPFLGFVCVPRFLRQPDFWDYDHQMSARDYVLVITRDTRSWCPCSLAMVLPSFTNLGRYSYTFLGVHQLQYLTGWAPPRTSEPCSAWPVLKYAKISIQSITFTPFCCTNLHVYLTFNIHRSF